MHRETSIRRLAVGGFEWWAEFGAGVEEHVGDDGEDDDGAAKKGPTRGAFTEDQEDPDRVQYGFDVTDDARIQ